MRRLKRHGVDTTFPFRPEFLAGFTSETLSGRGYGATSTDTAMLLAILGSMGRYFDRAIPGSVEFGVRDNIRLNHDQQGLVQVRVEAFDLMRTIGVASEKGVIEVYGRARWINAGIGLNAIDSVDVGNGYYIFHVPIGLVYRAAVVPIAKEVRYDHGVLPVNVRMVSDFKVRHSAPIYLRSRAWIETSCRDGLHDARLTPTANGGIKVDIPLSSLPKVIGSPDLVERSAGEILRILKRIEIDFQRTELGIGFRSWKNPGLRGKLNKITMTVDRNVSNDDGVMVVDVA